MVSVCVGDCVFRFCRVADFWFGIGSVLWVCYCCGAGLVNSCFGCGTGAFAACGGAWFAASVLAVSVRGLAFAAFLLGDLLCGFGYM